MNYTYDESVDFLNSLGKYGEHPGIENASRLLTLLGHPENSLRIVHVAGTNGKGSVCTYLADMMTANGLKTGLFISPHLVDIRERIQLDRRLIDRDSFAFYFSKVKAAADGLAAIGYTGITYFDYFFVISMCYYADQKADLVVVETGLGGRFDSTNAIEHPLLTIITSISFDHTEVLGDTLTKIASEKAGILKVKTPLIYCADEPEVVQTLEKCAAALGVETLGIARKDCTPCPQSDTQLTYLFTPDLTGNDNRLALSLNAVDYPLSVTVNSPAVYQAENSAIALSAAIYLISTLPNSFKEQNRFAGSLSVCLSSLRSTYWEGRFEQIAPNVYLDGAHNADGIRMLLSSLRYVLNSSGGNAQKKNAVTLLFTAVKEKDTHEMIREICESGLFSRYLLTTISGPRAIAPEILKDQFAEFTVAPIETFSTPQEALNAYQSAPDDFLMIAGSLYLVGLIKELNSTPQ